MIILMLIHYSCAYDNIALSKEGFKLLIRQLKSQSVLFFQEQHQSYHEKLETWAACPNEVLTSKAKGIENLKEKLIDLRNAKTMADEKMKTSDDTTSSTMQILKFLRHLKLYH